MLQKSLPAAAAEAEVCQAQRMEIVGQLTGGVVHDFNNILTVITGTIEILAEAVADRPELAAIARLIDEAATRGANLTSHLLAFARGQPSQPRDVDVNALLVEAARLLRPTLGEQVEIYSMLATDVSPAWVDPSLLMTAILNLAIIARDAMPEGGKLTLETRSAVAGANNGEVTAEDYVMIAVNACGHGIFADGPDRAFVEIGMIKDFITQSDGHIKVCNEAGRGTSVEIHLPRAAGLVRSPAEDSSGAHIERGGEAILIVEDDAMVRKYVVTQVQSLGYRTLAAGNASEALTIINRGEEIDLLFTDVMMPGPVNGLQLAIEALNRRPSLKVLYTSGYAANALVHDRHLDADALLLAKPYRKVDLARMIRNALAA
jgi:CheY-like chemotaxis protein